MCSQKIVMARLYRNYRSHPFVFLVVSSIVLLVVFFSMTFLLYIFISSLMINKVRFITHAYGHDNY